MLKLNHQVLVRKLQAGEIPAYKIGKDWRIEEGELRAWLRSVSNQPSGPSGSEEEEIRRRFFEGGRLKPIPAKRSRREVVLKILAESFQPGREYREAEVNEILTGFHPDFCTLRRELVMAHHLEREAGRYRRAAIDGSAAGESGAPPPSSGEKGELPAAPLALVLDRVARADRLSSLLGDGDLLEAGMGGECPVRFREVGRDIGRERENAARQKGSRGEIEERTAEQAALGVPLLRPWIGKVDMDRGDGADRRPAGQDVESIRADQADVRSPVARDAIGAQAKPLAGALDAEKSNLGMERRPVPEEEPLAAADLDLYGPRLEAEDIRPAERRNLACEVEQPVLRTRPLDLPAGCRQLREPILVSSAAAAA